jgi:hypothetical protein
VGLSSAPIAASSVAVHEREPYMSHVGVAIDHPLNAQILAYLTQRPTAIERGFAIRSLEAMVAKSPTAILLSALQKLRDNRPDAARTPSQSPEGVSLLSLGALPEIVERLWKAGLALPTDCRWVADKRAILAHSTTGIIFGLAVGTFGIAVRLPQANGETVEFGGTASKLPYRSGRQKKSLSALECGPDWRFIVDPAAIEVCALAAYIHFGEASLN